MTSDDSTDRRPYRDRPWERAIGILLMLPIGLILLLALIFLFGGRSSFGGGWWLIVIAVLLVLFVVRISFRRSQRRYWMQRHRGRNDPLMIIQERYARGEITKEQFDQMAQDLQRRRYP
jgi:uncharacterized membrane protein